MPTRRCYNCMNELNGTAQICLKCGFDNSLPNQPAQALPCGTILHGRYFIGRMLGQGGFGITYIGYDYTLEVPLCIKEFFPAGGAMRDPYGNSKVYWSSDSTGAAMKQGRETFVKEAQKAAKVRSLPSVVNVWDVFYENDTAYIVMEYIRGMTVKEFLIRRGTVMDIVECLNLFDQVMRDLQGVHEKGIVHRDISPDNLMIGEDGKVKLLDLGAAKDLSKGTGQSSTIVHKKGFSPPEQYTAKMNIGPWTDVYAMCATIYWCMTGKVIPEAMERLLGDTVFFPGTMPEGVVSALKRGLELKPEERTSSFEKLIIELERAAKTGRERKRPVTNSNPNKQDTTNVSDIKSSLKRRCYNCMSELKGTAQRCEKCGYDNSRQDQPELPFALPCGTTLHNRYYVGRMVAKEATFKYLCYDCVQNTPVYIKELFPGDYTKRDEESNEVCWKAGNEENESKQLLKLYAKEARKAINVGHLSSVINIRDIFFENKTIYVVTDYYQGINLADYTKKKSSLDERECISLLSPVMRDLQIVHEKAIVHRVITPDNLILCNDGMVKLTDFTNFLDEDYRLDHLDLPYQGMNFSPPERFTEKGRMSIGPWSDVYAMCASIYWCITGKLIPLAPERIMNTAIEYPSNISPAVASVLRKGLELKIVNRTQNISELMVGLEKATKIDHLQSDKLEKSGKLSKDIFKAWVDRTAEAVTFLNTMSSAPVNAADLSEAHDRSVLGWTYGSRLFIAGKGGIEAPDDCSYLFSDKESTEVGSGRLWTGLVQVLGAKHFKMSQVTTTKGMFSNCYSLKNIEMNSWDMSNVKNMGAMFQNCLSIEKLNLNNWDTQNAVYMWSMFSGCKKLKKLKISNWNTSNVISMMSMFAGCRSLEVLDLSGWDISNVADRKALLVGTNFKHVLLPNQS